MKNIVTVGGGTGSYIVLSGLKHLPNVNLSAVVSMADDGGSTGVLRKKWAVMPAGDVRQCLAALSGKNFLNHRIESGPFKGHKIGNIFFAILEKLSGNFTRALKILSFLFGAKGRIIPVTRDQATLCVELSGGKLIIGEGNIDKALLQTEYGVDLVERVFYKENVTLNPSARDAILKADYIIICPGNIYCSILPNLITEGFAEAAKESKAKIILIVNLANKQGHTMGWNEERYINVIQKYLGRGLDIILINQEEFTAAQREYYARSGGEKIFITNHLEDPRIVKRDLLSHRDFVQEKNDSVKRSLIRHDPEKLASAIEKIIN